MNLKRIELSAFKCFDKKDFSFDAINLVTGRNGIGKSTLILDSLLFAIYGYSDKPLKDLVTKNKRECRVTVEIDDLIITRKHPTSLSITKGGKELTIANNVEKQTYLDSLFKDVEYFRKFRMIDIKQGINILESGKTTLIKTLIGFHQDYFNEKRQMLLDKKSAKETFNRDRLKLAPHYPSEYRLKVLKKYYDEINQNVMSFNRDWSSKNNHLTNAIRAESALHCDLKANKARKERFLQLDDCPTCLQKVPEIHKNRIASEIDLDLECLAEQLQEKTLDTAVLKTDVERLDELRLKANARKERLIRLITILEDRVKQKIFKYTEKDVAISKKAIHEFDLFCARYITDWIKTLEPIINDIIKKIGFEVKFSLGSKGEVDLKLYKNRQEFSYRELSTGQRLILSIGFKLGILLQKGEHGLIIADEGMSSLDSENLEYVFSIMEGLPFQLLAVVHRYEPNNQSINVIDLNKHFI